MEALLIKSNNENRKLILEFAEKLGAEVLKLKEEHFEDFALAKIIQNEETKIEVSKGEILKKLNNN